jgi:DNA-binding SARP family transcriptional activator
MEFGILGPLFVRRGGSAVPLASRKQRALLASLLLHANQPVSQRSVRVPAAEVVVTTHQ